MGSEPQSTDGDAWARLRAVLVGRYDDQIRGLRGQISSLQSQLAAASDSVLADRVAQANERITVLEARVAALEATGPDGRIDPKKCGAVVAAPILGGDL